MHNQLISRCVFTWACEDFTNFPNPFNNYLECCRMCFHTHTSNAWKLVSITFLIKQKIKNNAATKFGRALHIMWICTLKTVWGAPIPH